MTDKTVSLPEERRHAGFIKNNLRSYGMLLVIVTGHIDLSVGSVAGFVGAVAAVLMVHYHVAYPIAFIACLVVGAAIGAAQGYWIAYFGIPSFIVTLAGML